MISGSFVYDGINVLIGVAALISLFLVPRVIPEKQARRKLVAALVFLILTGVIFSASLRFFRLSSVAYMGEGVGRVGKGTFAFVDRFKTIALAGNILELAAISFLASVAKTLMRRESGAVLEKENA